MSNGWEERKEPVRVEVVAGWRSGVGMVGDPIASKFGVDSVVM